ncbi:MAG: response regulator [Candidatus Pacebacteria bacterium]|nr:response regulator [Candidatus Paceibacterota bacterium]
MDEQKKIIIVEDDHVLRDVLAEKLEKSGYIVDKAQDGIIAMEKIRATKPDCVLLDILMPRMGGIAVLEQLHADPDLRDIPTIIISNSGQPVEIQRAQELGAREFLIKAVFDPNEVLDKVRRVLAGGAAAPQGEWGVRTQNVTGAGAAVRPDAPSTSPAKPSTAEKGIFILVVEDDKFLRELLVRKLSSEGFDVKNAIDAQAAFAILAERKPNIILLDLILPGIDGFEILSQIKSDAKIADVPVIILSNLGQKEDTDKAMALGAEDFMVKANFTLDEIVTKVRGIVG